MIGFFDQKFRNGFLKKSVVNGTVTHVKKINCAGLGRDFIFSLKDGGKNFIGWMYEQRDREGKIFSRWAKEQFFTWEYTFGPDGFFDRIRMDVVWQRLRFLGLNNFLSGWRFGDGDKYFLERAVHYFLVEKRDEKKRPVRIGLTNIFWPSRSFEISPVAVAITRHQTAEVSYLRGNVMRVVFGNSPAGFGFYHNVENWQLDKDGGVVFTATANKGFLAALKESGKI